MALVIAAEPVPLETDAEGVARVGRTRVTLDTVVDAFLSGEPRRRSLSSTSPCA